MWEQLAGTWKQHAAAFRIDQAVLKRAGRTAQQLTLQLGLYAMILTGAIGVTYSGGDILMSMIHSKMTEMSQEVIKLNLPKGIETASLKTAVQ